jgi:hypothetical protein
LAVYWGRNFFNGSSVTFPQQRAYWLNFKSIEMNLIPRQQAVCTANSHLLLKRL